MVRNHLANANAESTIKSKVGVIVGQAPCSPCCIAAGYSPAVTWHCVKTKQNKIKTKQKKYGIS